MNLYHLPMKEACKALGVSESSLRNICRKYNIDRWPFRKFQQLDQHIESIKHAPPSPKNAEMIQVLTLARTIMQKNPNLSVELSIVQGNKQLSMQQQQQNQLQATANFLKQQEMLLQQQQQPSLIQAPHQVPTNTTIPTQATTSMTGFPQQTSRSAYVPQAPFVLQGNVPSVVMTSPSGMPYTNPYANVLIADASGVYGYVPTSMLQHPQPTMQQQQPSTSTQQQSLPLLQSISQQQTMPKQQEMLMQQPISQQQQQQPWQPTQIIIKQQTSPTMQSLQERSSSTDNTSQFFQ